MTASGEISWPPMGIFPWPPTVANASAYRLGRTHNPMPARVMKKRRPFVVAPFPMPLVFNGLRGRRRDCNFFGVTPEKEGDTCDRCDER